MKVPRPQKVNAIGELILKKYATADDYIGLHFQPYEDFIITPVIKQQILDAQPTDAGHITVYLPSYCKPQLTAIFSAFKDFTFEIFSFETAGIVQEGNLRFIPVDRFLFNKSLINCHAIITGGGFETPAEAIHLGKKIMSIPIRGQYEQMCNAAALQQMGVMTLDKINGNFKQDFERWINDYKPIQKDYSKSVETSMERLFG